MNFNKVLLLGNVASDIEVRTLPSGQAVASFRLATNRTFKDAQGNLKKDAQFHNIVVFGRLADIVSKYLGKGNVVFVEGRLNYRNWQDANGVKKYWTEIVAETIQLPPKKWSEGAIAAEEFSPLNASSSEQSLKDVPIVPEEDPFGNADSTEKKDSINVEEDLPF